MNIKLKFQFVSFIFDEITRAFPLGPYQPPRVEYILLMMKNQIDLKKVRQFSLLDATNM